MREAILILFAACIAALPFVAFNEWFQTAPRHHETVSLWGDDLRQTGQPYSMPKIVTVNATLERR